MHAQPLPAPRIARGTATLFGGNVVLLALQTLQFVLLARVLGIEQFARVAAANALIAIALPLSGLGYGNVLLMQVARNRDSLHVQIGNTQLAVVALGLCLVTAVTLLACVIYGSGTDIRMVIALATSELILVRSVTSLGQVYQALDRVEVTSVLYVGVGLCRVASIALLALAGVHDATVWALTACGILLAFTLTAGITAAQSLGAPRVSFRHLWANRADAMHFSLGTGAKALYTDLDKVLLGHSAAPAELGAYTAAYRLVVMAFLPVRSLLDASATAFYRHGANGLAHSYGFTRRLLGAVLPYGVLAALIMLLGAQWAPRVLGPSFACASSVLYWLAPLPLIQAIHYSFSDALTASGMQKLRTRLQWTVAAVYAASGALLIPRYGWRGAAAVCLFSETLLASLIVMAVRNKTRGR